MILMRLSPLILAAATLAACASQQDSAGSPHVAVAPIASAVAPPAPVDAKSKESKPRAPSGYRLEERKGQTFYCQDVTRVGTRFTTEVCMTQAQYEELERRSQSMRESMQKPVVCAGASCNGG